KEEVRSKGNMNPSKKHPAMEKALTDLFGHDRRETIQQNRCVPPPIGCGKLALSFRDELSRREYTISGLCQDCQDTAFGKPKKPIPPTVGPNDFVIGRKAMTCGRSDAQGRRYRKYVTKEGNVWLVADQPNAADNIYFHNPQD